MSMSGASVSLLVLHMTEAFFFARCFVVPWRPVDGTGVRGGRVSSGRSCLISTLESKMGLTKKGVWYEPTGLLESKA